MKQLSILLTAGVFALAGCGDDDDDSAGSAPVTTADDSAMEKEGDAMKKEGDAMKAGTTIAVGKSEFGDRLCGSHKQAIYIRENDRANESVCYDERAAAWLPALTRGEPTPGNGVDARLIGTTERRDGSLPVTYDDQPLYYYAHEGPGEV